MTDTEIQITAQTQRDLKNGWGRSHLPPHGRGGNMFLSIALQGSFRSTLVVVRNVQVPAAQMFRYLKTRQV